MESESLQARIQHESAELMALHPQIGVCRATLDRWKEGTEDRYSLSLDIRWPQHQTLISGDAKDSALGALEAAFGAARRQLGER
jgi:hypothetical protein